MIICFLLRCSLFCVLWKHQFYHWSCQVCEICRRPRCECVSRADCMCHPWLIRFEHVHDRFAVLRRRVETSEWKERAFALFYFYITYTKQRREKSRYRCLVKRWNNNFKIETYKYRLPLFSNNWRAFAFFRSVSYEQCNFSESIYFAITVVASMTVVVMRAT